MRATHVAIEGPDGAGKTTAFETLRARMAEPLFVTRPTDDRFGGIFRDLARTDEYPAELDVLTMQADRAEHLRDEIEPALESGTPVVSDRSVVSTYVYQAGRVAGGREWINSVREPWAHHPDHVVLLSAGADTLAERASGADKYESADKIKLKRETYGRMLEYLDIPYTTVDASMPKKIVADRVGETIRREADLSAEPLPREADE